MIRKFALIQWGSFSLFPSSCRNSCNSSRICCNSFCLPICVDTTVTMMTPTIISITHLSGMVPGLTKCIASIVSKRISNSRSNHFGMIHPGLNNSLAYFVCRHRLQHVSHRQIIMPAPPCPVSS
jgi:hypothetical protein